MAMAIALVDGLLLLLFSYAILCTAIAPRRRRRWTGIWELEGAAIARYLSSLHCIHGEEQGRQMAE